MTEATGRVEFGPGTHIEHSRDCYDELVQLRGENLAALRTLVALPHPDAIPASWRRWSHPSVRKDTITLADVVALLCPASTGQLGRSSAPLIGSHRNCRWSPI